MLRHIAISLAAASACALAAWALAEDAPAPPKAHFHHVHVNAVDPEASAKFYAGKFEAEPKTWAGQPGVWAYKSWVFFKKAAEKPPSDIVSGIWHMGWGAEDMNAEYRKQLDSGTKFETPITDISDLAGRPPGSFFFAYVDGPDHELIELNTSNNHHFGHVHMLSADPLAAADWYEKRLGITVRGRQRERRMYKQFPVAPAAFLQADHVSMIIYPIDYARAQWPALWKDRKSFEPTRGRAIDHIGFSVDDLGATVARLRQDGVKILMEPRPLPGGAAQIAFVEAPDRVWVELVQEKEQ